MTGFKPKLSVITIVYNNVQDIERTMASVINQTYPYIEYIVIDGASTDGTKEAILKNSSSISTFISEPDKGIYDAMNKGLALATGDYVLFMNSGDEIYSNDTVAKVFASSTTAADIYYGETEMFNERWESLGQRRHQTPQNFSWKSFRYGMSISHQAIYIKRSLTSPYDLKYKYSADIDWILKAAKKATVVVNTHMYVAKYLVGGISKQKHLESLKERFDIFTKHYGLLHNVLNHLVIGINIALYYIKHRRTND
jgi:glycosyltransferase involved in cell wall biosynthesis